MRHIFTDLQRAALAAALLVLGAVAPPSNRIARAETRIDIVGPAGSDRFGSNVNVLPNGNILVIDAYFDLATPTGVLTDTGAVHLYDGATLRLISTLTGGSTYDNVGVGGATVLANGNVLIGSHYWDNQGLVNAGAVTWINATTGLSGTVSASNSLVGGTPHELIGVGDIVALHNGNFVVYSRDWSNGRGAVTWGNGTTGVSGIVNGVNSLLGTRPGDLSYAQVYPLRNGNYVVVAPKWDNGATVDAGAVTWGNGNGGTAGQISAANSLVGAQADDSIGWRIPLYSSSPFPYTHLIELTNSNYVVVSTYWNNGVITDTGAVTWGNGQGGTVGVVGTTNSLVGSSLDERLGSYGVVPLVNSNYVIVNPIWADGATVDVGAVTWANGAGGTVGAVTAGNSLIGQTAGDRIGSPIEGRRPGVVALSNGNYVVVSPLWNNGAVADAGAVTWAFGGGHTSGRVQASNSVVGTSTDDKVGIGGVVALTNGNYVVKSQLWDNGAVSNAGAATWCNGLAATALVVGASNSLVGDSADDFVGNNVVALSNGNYVVGSRYWNNVPLSAVRAGAATWGNGAAGTVGVVSASNSLVGGQTSDDVGVSVQPLSNGNYVVVSSSWDFFNVVNAGAVTWGNGSGGTVGLISLDNSLVGTSPGDSFGNDDLTPLTSGNYLALSIEAKAESPAEIGALAFGNGSGGSVGRVSSANSLVGVADGDMVDTTIITLSNGGYVAFSPYVQGDLGAVTWGNGFVPVNGPINAFNSLIGATADSLPLDSFEFKDSVGFDAVRNRLAIGRPGDHIVTLVQLDRYPPPEVVVAYNGQTLAFGDGVDFGSVAISAAPLQRTLVVSNTGPGELAVSSLSVDNPAFAIAGSSTFTVVSGGGVSVTLSFDPSSVGAITATLSIISDDADESQATFTLSGIGLADSPTPVPGNRRIYLPLARRAPGLTQ